MRRRNQRNLSSAEVALWAQVARSVKAFPGKSVPAEPEQPETLSMPAQIVATPPAAIGTPAKASLKPLAPFERKLRTQLRRGQQPIEAVIDLHGLRQSQAHDALHAFLRGAQESGARLVLVVTGKGAAAAGQPALNGGSDERGVLRRMVPHWLQLPGIRFMVAGFEEADRRHGGSGALYVRLRRGRVGD